MRKNDDSEFPDIFSKPGKFLPGILDNNAGNGFEEINIEDSDKKQKATDLQNKLKLARIKTLKQEKDERKK